MKKYDSYKDSGIEWIEEIPSHWESWKISHAFNRIGSGTTPESGNPIYHENGTVNWLNTGDLNDGLLDSCSKQITQKALEDYSSLKLFPAGSLVMAMYGATIGKTAILNFETTTNQACCVFCESEIINLRFLQYWFIGNKEQIINLAIGGGQPNISQNILKDIRLWCPDYSEQLSLNKFLDQKTTQIDDLIAKKERLINLLEEERIAIINQAVTKGLPAEERLKAGLDPNVPMKDSGVEWLGEIPEHWEVKKIGHVSKVVRGASPRPAGDPLLFNGDFLPWITVKEVTNAIGKFIISTESFLTEEGSKQTRIIEPETLLLSNSGATLGVPRITKIRGGINDGSVAFFNLKIEKDFLYYFFTTHIKIFRDEASGYGQPNLNTDIVKSTKIPIPNETEQIKIVQFIEDEILRIESIIFKSHQEIELLKEYKTALISEVVTGKVDVRNEKLN